MKLYVRWTSTTACALIRKRRSPTARWSTGACYPICRRWLCPRCTRALRWRAAKPETAEALRAHGSAIARDVLAVEFAEAGDDIEPGDVSASDEELGLTVAFAKA